MSAHGENVVEKRERRERVEEVQVGGEVKWGEECVGGKQAPPRNGEKEVGGESVEFGW